MQISGATMKLSGADFFFYLFLFFTSARLILNSAFTYYSNVVSSVTLPVYPNGASWDTKGAKAIKKTLKIHKWKMI